MYILYIITALGFILYFYDDLKHGFMQIKSIRLSGLLDKAIPKRKQSLKEKVAHLSSKKKVNFIASAYQDMAGILALTGEKDKLKSMRILSALCGAFGVILSFYLKSYMLVPILGIGLALLPMWLIKFKAYKYNLRMQNELSVVLSMVTNSYVRTENLIKSVSENLSYMNEPVRSVFEHFVFSCNLVNSNTISNISALKNKMDNHIFRLWCDNLIMCQNDINQKYSLNAVVEQFSADKELYNMLSAEIAKPMQVFVAIVLLTSCAFPVAFLFGRQLGINAFDLLFDTLTGQFIVIGYVVCIFYGINMAINLSTSIE